MTKPLSNRILLFAFFSASVLFAAGVFYIAQASQLFHINGMSVLKFFIGAYDATHIQSVDSILLGTRVLLMGMAKVWISITVFLLAFSKIGSRRDQSNLS